MNHLLSPNYVEELLLSPKRLGKLRCTQEGKIDVFEALESHENDCGSLDLASRPPKKSLILEWKELMTPPVPSTMHDLVGKRLAEYTFQYVGRFFYGDELVEVNEERFAANFGDGASIYDDVINYDAESDNKLDKNWVNCTWFIDFLMNAGEIEKDPLRKEQLHWHKEGKKGHFFDLTRQMIDNTSQEQEYFVFKDDYTTLMWSHEIQFAEGFKVYADSCS